MHPELKPKPLPNTITKPKPKQKRKPKPKPIKQLAVKILWGSGEDKPVRILATS